jgi:uncharacterized protein (TIGR02246 family)
MQRASTSAVPFALAVAAALLLSSGCRPAPGETRAEGAGAGAAPLSAADLAAIRATDTAFATAAGAGDAAGLAALYLADAHLMPPNAATIAGREGIRRFWDGFVGAYRIQTTVTAEDIEGYGDLAYARGRYTMDLTPKDKGGAAMHEEGKFLEVLRRQPDGTWRYAVDMYSSDLPAPK